MRIRVRWLSVTASLVLLAIPAWAQRVAGNVEHRTVVVQSTLDPDGERIATFLAGGSWQKLRRATSASPTPGPAHDETQPTPHGWLEHWRVALLQGLLPARMRLAPPTHPLLTMQPTVIVHNPAHSGVGQAATLPWPSLACPESDAGIGDAAGQPGLALQVLHVGDDGVHELGVDVWCRLPRLAQLRRFTRLFVRTDGQGRVLSAAGVVLDTPLPLADTPMDAVVTAPFAPAFSGPRQPPWLVATSAGWVAQVQVARRATASLKDALPHVEFADLGPADNRAPARAIWFLDARAQPRSLLLDGTTSDGRMPLPQHGTWDHPLGEDGMLLLQAIGVPHVQDGGIAWLDAGMAAWRLQPDGKLQPLAFALPRLPREGLWACLGALQGFGLRCQFQGPQLPGRDVPADEEFEFLSKSGMIVRAPGGP